MNRRIKMKRMKQELEVLRNKPIHVQIVKDSRKVSRLRIEKSFNKFTVDALSQDYIQFQVLNEFIEYIRPYINISNNQNICLQRIKDTIYYDTRTGIVYFWNGYNYYNAASMPSPYYAPNGLPYKWDPITEKLEEIDR